MNTIDHVIMAVIFISSWKLSRPLPEDVAEDVHEYHVIMAVIFISS